MRQRPGTLLLAVTLLVWWVGVGGRDLYLLPALALVGWMVAVLVRGGLAGRLRTEGACWRTYLEASSFGGWVKAVFIVHVLILLLLVICKYYSFRLNVWDAGIQSNILFNISRGRFYSSFLDAHSLADHFTPSMSVISPLYRITPSALWMMVAKVAAYVAVPLVLYRIARNEFDSVLDARLCAVLLGIMWLGLYAPSVNSMYYEFQSSSLAPPLVLCAFLWLRRRNWIRFALVMVFLIGLKEHMGVVFIGMGGYLILGAQKRRMGALFVAIGGLALYVIVFQLMPYFRDYQPSWNTRVDPLIDVPGKLIYLLKLLAPLAFLPVIFWRYGILAAPAVGINLVSARSAMYSTSFHYDDVASVLLFVATLLAVRDLDLHRRMSWWLDRRWLQWSLVLWIGSLFALLPASPVRRLAKAIPEEKHWEIRRELKDFDAMSAGAPIAVQSSLGIQFYRNEIRAVVQTDGADCSEENGDSRANFPVRYIVLAPSLGAYKIDDMERCIEDLRRSKKFRRVNGYNHLEVYEDVTLAAGAG